MFVLFSYRPCKVQNMRSYKNVWIWNVSYKVFRVLYPGKLFTCQSGKYLYKMVTKYYPQTKTNKMVNVVLDNIKALLFSDLFFC